MAESSEPSQPEAGQLHRWLENESARFLATVEMLWHADFNAQSLAPGLSTGFVVTHVARSADQFADRLRANRGAGPELDRERRCAEPTGALRPGAVIIDDVVTAFERLSRELDGIPADSAPSEPRVAEIPAEFLSEVVLHHADLGSSFGELEAALADALFIRAVHGLDGQPSWPEIAVIIEKQAVCGASVFWGDAQTVIRGDGRALLAWVTGRPSASELRAEVQVQLPKLPAWRCARPIDEFLAAR